MLPKYFHLFHVGLCDFFLLGNAKAYLDIINEITEHHQMLETFYPAEVYFGTMNRSVFQFANSMNMLAFAASSSAKTQIW